MRLQKGFCPIVSVVCWGQMTSKAGATENVKSVAQSHGVNDFDFCFVSKCFHIATSRSKPKGFDF